MTDKYDYRNCQSLFGYAFKVHFKSGGICQLCGCGKGNDVNFHLWRQMTVEHLIGESQGGYLKDIRKIITDRFLHLSSEDIEQYSLQIDLANTVTACSFCNSTTSRDRNTKSMRDLIFEVEGTPEDVIQHVKKELNSILDRKSKEVEWKLESVKKAFEREVRPKLEEIRRQL